MASRSPSTSSAATAIDLDAMEIDNRERPADATTIDGLREKAIKSEETVQGDAEPEMKQVQEGNNTTSEKFASDLEAGPQEVIVVDWDGPNDPKNPQNWIKRKKWSATVAVSLFTFLSPLSSTFMSPTSRQLAIDFNITKTVELEMCTSIFLLAYALGPLGMCALNGLLVALLISTVPALGPLSEIYGRVRVLQFANLFFMLFNFVIAWSPNKEAFIVFRFLAGIGGSGPLSIGGGVIGDVWRREERGMAVAIYSLCPLLSPVFGPLFGSLIAEYSRWEWVFWSTTIFTLFVQIIGWLYLRESYAPVLLERKAAALRKETGSEIYKSKYATSERHWQKILYKGLSRPFYLFIHEPIVQTFAVVQMLVYGQLYLIMVTIGNVFTSVYGWRQSVAGCVYIALGIGITGMSQTQGRTMDRVYSHFARTRNNGKGKPEYRLIFLFPAGIMLPIGFILYGISAEHHVFWLVPCIGLVFMGAGMIGFFQPTQLYIIDCYTLHAASALAAVTFLRSVCGFAFPLFANQMFETLGLGGGSGLLAGISFLIGIPIPYLLWRYGEKIRMASKHAEA